MPVTQKQKEIAARLVELIKNDPDMTETLRQNIAKENEYMAKYCKHHKPTREQMQAEYNSPEIK